MSSDKVYLDFHVIQTAPPSCVNRDDTGSPKTGVYGGVRRARVSSQCWKRAMRKMFREHFDEKKLGTRTKRIVDMVAEKMIARDASLTSDAAKERAEKIINAAGVQTKDGEAKALFFMSDSQADNLARLALDAGLKLGAEKIAGSDEKPSTKKKQKNNELPSDVKKALKDAVNQGHGVDMALFGRMVADDSSLNVDASAQVAHALSTHKVDNEFDYYTAHGDHPLDDEPSADMIGTIEFNSATLYRYATVAVHDLHRQLAGDPEAVAETVREFARAFIESMPTGRQNTFANRTTPNAVMVTLRNDRPNNLVDAFETPVPPSAGGGFTLRSVEKLANHAKQVYRDFDCEPKKTWVIGEGWHDLGDAVSLAGLLKALEQEMRICFETRGNAS